jgi:hypothetical protein
MTLAKAVLSFVHAPRPAVKASASHTAAVPETDVPQASFRRRKAASVRPAKNGSRAKMLGHSNGRNGSHVAMTPVKAVVSFVRAPLQAVKASASRTAAAPETNAPQASFRHETAISRVRRAGSGSLARKEKAKRVASSAHAAVPSPRSAVHSNHDLLRVAHLVRAGKAAVFPEGQNPLAREARSPNAPLRIEKAQIERSRRRENAGLAVRVG